MGRVLNLRNLILICALMFLCTNTAILASEIGGNINEIGKDDNNVTQEGIDQLTENSNPEALNNIGNMYYKGQGVNKDYKQAVKWFSKAAEQGHVLAQCNLGVMYENGWGVSQNYHEAVQWYRKAAEKGFAQAQYSLGLAYMQGQGITRNDKEAQIWLRKAAEQGYILAQCSLGILLIEGQGVPKDHQEAAKWFRKAAENGYAQAQYNLGILYYNGQGVPQNYQEAIQWYRKAAEQGDASAQYNLGVMYHKGQGVRKDYKEAVNWYRKAAEQGDRQAQSLLGKTDKFLLSIVFIGIVWIILSIIVGAIALSKDRSFFANLLLSLIFSPLIGFCIIYLRHPQKTIKDEQSPEGRLAAEGDIGIIKRINYKAILLGALTDFCGSILYIAALVIFEFFNSNKTMILQHQTESEVLLKLNTPEIIIFSLCIGFGFTVLGGYIAGRIAKHSQMLHGAIVGGIGLIIGVGSFVIELTAKSFDQRSPLWVSLVSLVGVIPFGILGGRLAKVSPKNET